MTRSPLVLAALASSAVPGLDPVTVEGVAAQAGQQFEVAVVQDSQDRRWIVRAPVSQAASAQMEATVALLGLLARRLPFAVPAPRGFATLKGGGRAMVYPHLPGHPIDLAGLPEGPGLAAEIGRTVAQLHNVDLALYDEAGVPAYDPESYRTRRLAELDRAAATGSVPSGLLERWERALEELTLWRFAPTPTHGALTGRHILITFDDEGDAASGHVRALTGWEHAQVADPADDFAGLVAYAPPAALDTALEAYAHGRAERPDPHLRRRAQLASELAVVGGLLRALAADEPELVEFEVTRLRDLEARVKVGSAHPLTQDERPPPAPPGPASDANAPTDADADADADDPDEAGYDLERPESGSSAQAATGGRRSPGYAGGAEQTEIIDVGDLRRFTAPSDSGVRASTGGASTDDSAGPAGTTPGETTGPTETTGTGGPD